jgi:hypothetical protein
MTDLVACIEKIVAENRALKAANLKLSTKPTNENANAIIMQSRLNRMGVCYDDFADILDEDSTVFAGGLVAQTMLGEFWHSDIDIFTTDAGVVMSHLSKRITFKLISGEYNRYANKVWRGEYTKGVIVEVIQVPNIYYAISEFDLDFCKCWFDGSNFHTQNKKALVTKTHIGRVNSYPGKDSSVREFIKKSRINKYKCRGFTVVQPVVKQEVDEGDGFDEGDVDEQANDECAPVEQVDAEEKTEKVICYCAVCKADPN